MVDFVMKTNDIFLLTLLSNFAKHSIPQSIEPIDWDKLYAKCASQNIDGLVASVVNQLPEECRPDNYPVWFTAYIETLRSMTRRNLEFDRMIRLMIDRGIEPIGLKGCVLRKLYPDEALRTMGDFDIFIREQERLQAVELFETAGYSVKYDYSVYAAEKDDIRFEFFTTLQHDFPVDSTAWNELLRENVCRNKDGFLQLNPTYELLYIVVHATKHYKTKGCGIRNLLDMALILQKEAQSIDFKEVSRLCDQLGIKRYLQYFLSALQKYFQIETAITVDMPKADIFTEYMLTYGIYGLENDKGNPFFPVIKGEETGLRRKMLFPPYEYMLHGYPFLKKSKLLLPVAWVCRGFKGIFVRQKTPAKMLADMQASEEFSKVRMKYLKELGLWYE